MILLLIVLILSFYLFHLLHWKRRNLPPGPAPLPIIGNLFHMRADTRPGYKLWKELSQKYGKVFTFWMSHQPIVMVTDWHLIKESFIKNGAIFVGRPEFPMSVEVRGGKAYGIIEANGDRWKHQRRFVLHIMRDFGMGKNLMEEKIIDELQALITTIRKEQEKNKKIDMMDFFDSAVGSIINNILVGYRYDETNIGEFLGLRARMAEHFKIASDPPGAVIAMYPWMGDLPVLQNAKKAVVGNWEEIRRMFRRQAEEKLKYIDYENNEYSDYVEAFLKERKKHEHEPNYGGFEMEQLENVCFDLWVAGMETTSNTLYWALLYVLVNDDVRKKVYEELDSKIGNDRIITTSDRNNLDYINATINESQRLANLLPMNLSRVTTENTIVGGFKIPEGTVINPLISQVLYDEEIFPEPEKFKPERFLDENEKLKKIEEFIPFSIGKRQCPGEGLAKMELFLFFANLFNQFEVKLDVSNPTPSLEKDFELTVKAKRFKVNMISRF